MAGKREKGDGGETMARAFLEAQGWRILAQNYRSPYGEIDLIGEEAGNEGPILIFVEVKARGSERHGLPVEAVDARKQQRIVLTARHYLAAQEAGGEEPACRFDIAEVFLHPDGTGRVVLHRGAFGAT